MSINTISITLTNTKELNYQHQNSQTKPTIFFPKLASIQSYEDFIVLEYTSNYPGFSMSP